MTGAEIIADVRLELLEPVAGFWTDSELLTWINRAEKDFVNRIRGLEGTATLTTTAGRPDYPLPSNWVSARAVFYKDDTSGTEQWIPLDPTNLEKLKQERPNFLSAEVEARDVPRRYWLWGKSIYFDPVPKDSDKTVKMFFKSKPIPLTSSGHSLNIDDSLSGAIVAYVLWKAWSKEKELDLAESQKTLYYNFVRDGLRWVKRQSGDQVYRVDVRTHIPFSPIDLPRGINPF